jgi:predicted phosphodiesterase
MSKYAVISDIHGNILALQAVVDDMQKRKVSKVINLGDNISGPLWPQETICYLMTHNWINIRGNHDRQVSSIDQKLLRLSDIYAIERISDIQRSWLQHLPSSIAYDEEIVGFHGIPNNDTQYLLETISNQRLQLSSKADIANILGNKKSEVILCGHSHIPRCIQLKNEALILNPGSVGLQAYVDEENPHIVENGSPHARYALLEKNHDKWDIEFILVKYDWGKAAEKAGLEKRLDWEEALYSGYVT